MTKTQRITGTKKKGVWLCMMLFLLLLPSPVHATEGLGTLVRDGRLRVTTRIAQTQMPLYVTQSVTVHIEIATQGRFNGGTRIRGMQVSEAIILPPPAFAVNATRTVDGKQWAVQTWSLTLYPLKEKKYLLPALSLDVELVDREGLARRGVLHTKPQTFTAQLPPNAAEKEPWLAAENVTLTSTLRGPTENLEKGAAVIRTIEVEAEGVPGMMLRELASFPISGLALYPDAPEVGTASNRGSRLGWRRQRTTYIVQKPGRFLLPEYTLNWWNIHTAQWEQATTPAQIIQTKGIAPSAPLIKATRNLDAGPSSYGVWLWLLGGGSLLGALIVFILVPSMKKRKPFQFVAQWNVRRRTRMAVSKGKTLYAIRLFYQWYDQYGESQKSPSVRARTDNADFDALMERGFSDHKVERDTIQTDIIFSEVARSKRRKQAQSKPFLLND